MSSTTTSAAPPQQEPEGFQVHLDVFEGPFDLLLGLIAKHRLDVTEIALAQVTDEFLAHTKRLGGDDLDHVTQFLVVAATLLDLKAARLLPRGDVESEEDLALLEARDLLFARLLQYRAYQQLADIFAARLAPGQRRHPRQVALEDRYAELLPEVVVGLGPQQLAALAAQVLRPPSPPPTPSLAHLHAPRVSVREQAAVVGRRLRDAGSLTFRALIADAVDTTTTVARFLGLLELFKEGVVAFDQLSPMGELHVRWTGRESEPVVGEEFDA